ncbi:lipase [Bordetella ansorpii]|uniref:Lipase n=1 Tax=Bordetella ansorpii TaxID=288768 RepID=A0A157SW03_9BORD|nr:alpha/beta hydrolase [Bordetella ansorpii]SAI74514.1 lipase [Bordetella ansorpii]
MTLHPDLEAFLEMSRRASARPMTAMTPDEARAAYDRSTLALDTEAPELPTEILRVACRDGHAMRLRRYRGAARQPAPVLLYFHGGGYVLGSLESHHSLCATLAQQASCDVLAVEYRLAPEHRFPTAFEDAEDARLWLDRDGAALGLDTGRVIYGGDSVGGTLATALALADRLAGRPQPALQLLLYPCASARQDTASHATYACGHLLEAEVLQWMFNHYLRSARDRDDWRFAPLQATDLSGLAPARLFLARHDPLCDEGLAYARRLREAGVDAQVRVYEDMVHDFARLGNIVEQAEELRAELSACLRQWHARAVPAAPAGRTALA